MACKAIGARTLTRRTNPSSGPYFGALVLTGMQAGDTWDLRFSFAVINDGGLDCNAELYFEQNRDGGGWFDMSVASGSPQVSIGLAGVNYDKTFKPFVPGSYQYRVRVEYEGGPWYSSIGTAVVTTATPDAEPRGDVTGGGASSVAGSLQPVSVVTSASAASVAGSAVATATASSDAPEGTVG